MEVILNTEDIKSILGDYVITTFGKSLGIEKKEELAFDIAASYGALEKVTISKAEVKKEISGYKAGKETSQ